MSLRRRAEDKEAANSLLRVCSNNANLFHAVWQSYSALRRRGFSPTMAYGTMFDEIWRMVDGDLKAWDEALKATQNEEL